MFGWPPRSTRYWMLCWMLFFGLLLALGMPRLVRQARACFVPEQGERPGAAFFDFMLMRTRMQEYENTGVLYDTTGVDPFGPVTTSMFKYPPAHAAFLKVVAKDVGRSTIRGPLRAYRIVRPFVLLYLGSFVAALAALIIGFRPGWGKGILCGLVFLNWQAFWETMQGPQIEALMLFLLALSVLLARKREGWAGVPVGIAGGLKVYPWMIGIFLLLRRRWRGLIGLAAGAAIAFGAATLYVPLRISGEYLTRIMPRIGGLSLRLENVSIFGHVARLAHALTGETPPDTVYLGLQVLRQGGMTRSVFLLLVLALAAGAAVTVVTIRVARRAHPAPEREEILWLGVALSLSILFMPTAWSTYQTLLLVPAVVGVMLASNGDRLTWALLLCAIVAGSVNMGSVYSLPVVIVRGLIPVFLWMAYLRLLRESPLAAPAAAQEASGPSAHS
jgi:hypothetical protein